MRGHRCDRHPGSNMERKLWLVRGRCWNLWLVLPFSWNLFTIHSVLGKQARGYMIRNVQAGHLIDFYVHWWVRTTLSFSFSSFCCLPTCLPLRLLTYLFTLIFFANAYAAFLHHINVDACLCIHLPTYFFLSNQSHS